MPRYFHQAMAMTTAIRSGESPGGYPRLRHDLRISEQRTRQGIAYVVGVPGGGRFFRFGEPEYFIARQLDGATSPDEIRRRAETRFGSPLPAEALEKFLSRAGRIGLLEGARIAGAPAAEGHRIRGDPLYLRLKAIDPDRQLAWLLPRLRLCFTPGFVACSALLGLLALAIVVGNAADIGDEFSRLVSFHALAYAWLALLATMAGHEYAHGLTCKHFGGQVHEMGFMLIYLQPAVYCNVNDAWLFAEKSKRLWVTAAGPFLDMLMWAVATIAWRVTDPDSGIHFTALVVMVTTVGRTLVNLNPLIKLDAYYFLADLVEIHNLRPRAFRYLGGLWRRLWGTSAANVGTPAARERRIFIAYGVLAGAYSFLLLGYVALWLGQYLVERYRGLGFLILMGVLIMIFRHPLKQSLHMLPVRLRLALADDEAMKRRVRFAVPALLTLLAVLPVPITVSGSFTVLPTENADVRPDVDGVLESVHVKEGDWVEKGALIARLSNRDRQAALDQLDAEILERQARLRMLRLGARDEDVAVLRQRLSTAATREAETRRRYAEEKQLHAARLAAAEAGVEKAAEQLKLGEGRLAQTAQLEVSGFMSALALKEVQSDVVVRRKALEEARATLQYARAQNQEERHQEMALAAAGRLETERELQRLLAGSRPEELEAAAAGVASLEARRAGLRDEIRRAELRAPHAGVITTPRMDELVGQYFGKGNFIAEVHDLRRVTVEIAVPELNIGDVRAGQPVRLKARAFAGETFEGTVTGIAPATAGSGRPSGSKVVRVKTVIDNPDGLLKSDMTGVAKIEAANRPLVAVLLRDLVSTLRVEFWSWW